MSERTAVAQARACLLPDLGEELTCALDKFEERNSSCSLMHRLGIQGERRGKIRRTTVADPLSPSGNQPRVLP